MIRRLTSCNQWIYRDCDGSLIIPKRSEYGLTRISACSGTDSLLSKVLPDLPPPPQTAPPPLRYGPQSSAGVRTVAHVGGQLAGTLRWYLMQRGEKGYLSHPVAITGCPPCQAESRRSGWARDGRCSRVANSECNSPKTIPSPPVAVRIVIPPGLLHEEWLPPRRRCVKRWDCRPTRTACISMPSTRRPTSNGPGASRKPA